MLSGKLVHLIETHWDRIVASVFEAIRREPEMEHLRVLPDGELREWGDELLRNLGHWLAVGSSDDLARRYELRGRLRFEQGIPLHESVRLLCVMREKTMDYVEEHIASNSSMELFAEEELERRLSRFFDLLLIHLVRGYEGALRRSMAAA